MDRICSGLRHRVYQPELGRLPGAAAFEKGIERSTFPAMIPKLNAQAGLAMTRFIGGHPEAIRDLEELIVSMRLYENHVGAASASLMLGNCLCQVGELVRASACLDQAVDFYRHSRMSPFLAKALISMAELRNRQGRGAGGTMQGGSGIARFLIGQDPVEAARAACLGPSEVLPKAPMGRG
jgi:hypothetical protein